MARKVYILMAETTSPIAFNVPYPAGVYHSKRVAEAKAKERNESKRAQRRYYVRPAEFHDEETP